MVSKVSAHKGPVIFRSRPPWQRKQGALRKRLTHFMVTMRPREKKECTGFLKQSSRGTSPSTNFANWVASLEVSVTSTSLHLLETKTSTHELWACIYNKYHNTSDGFWPYHQAIYMKCLILPDIKNRWSK